MNNKMKTAYEKMKTAFIWSSFISFSIFFPFFNTIELVFYQTQKTFLIFCWVLNCLLFLAFLLSPSVYKLSIEYTFSKFSLLFLKFFEIGSGLLNKYPRVVGFFYGICFLSFLFRSEWPDSNSLLFVSSVLLAIRNLTVIPSLGFYSIAKWTSLTLEQLVKEKKLTESSIKNSLNDFQLFNSVLFSNLPLINQNPGFYNLETKRYMFGWVKTTTASLPKGETLSKTVRTTLGTTILGSFGLTTLTAGLKANSRALECLADATEKLEEIQKNSSTSSDIRETAREMAVCVDNAKLFWQNQTKLSAPYTGVKVILNQAQTREATSEVQTLFLESSKLKALSNSETKSPSQINELLKEIRKKSGLSENFINSPYESLIFLQKKLKFVLDFF